MRKLSLLLAALIIFNSVAFAAQSSGDTPQVVKVKAALRKRGTGEKSKVRVTLGNGTVVKGSVSKIEESSFEVNDSKTGHDTAIPYADVQKIQGPGLSKGAKIGIGVAVGVAATAAIVAILIEKSWNNFAKRPI